MPLTPGTRFGPYEIVAPLGYGGMGEVYRAHDSRLGRDVAVKVLPQHLSSSPEIRARFEREARTVSGLNHPHICTLHDVGREGDTDFLVMELVEGDTLADRLTTGPLPVADALRYGVQIADALDRAHRAGVIHRDLKPGNVMLTRSGAKLMDFGLARATGMAGPGGASGVTAAALTQTPTVAAPLTAEGTIVGTFQYMAPEQLEGKEADERSDLWALGCVLYEMVTGRRAFEGRSQASLISAIMGSEPAPISSLTPLSPPALDRVVRGCLAKDPEDRLQTAHDVKLQLAWIAEGGSQAGVPAPVAARRRHRERLAWTLFGFAGAATLALLALQLRPRPEVRPAIFELRPPAQVSFVDLPRISPDGTRLAFNATDSSGTSAIWVRSMNSLTAVRLQGTEGATRPFWSPDSRFLAFFSGGKLHKVDVSGGPPQVVCDAPRGSDGSWGSRGVILFDGSSSDSVQQVPASGGVPRGAAAIDRAHGEIFNAWPQFLPDGRHFLYIAFLGGDRRELEIGSLDSRHTQSLGPAGSRTEYVSGHLLFVRDGTLMAQRFDAGSRRTRGEPFPVAENVETDQVGSARFSASGNGTLVYRSGGSGATEQMIWIDRHGDRLGSVGGTGIYKDLALSPDETQLAVVIATSSGGPGEIWVWDLSRNLGSRFTFEGGAKDSPLWFPDGTRIIYSVRRGSAADLRFKGLGGAGGDSLLFKSNAQNYAQSWSPDGRRLVCVVRTPGSLNSWDLDLVTLGDTATSAPLLATTFPEYGGMVSPDGKLMTYVSWESGKEEVYVRTFPGAGGKWRISTHGGTEPAWRGDGRELFYLAPDRSLMSVQVAAGATPKFSLPQKLCAAPVTLDAAMRNRYLVTRDGQRFLMISPEGKVTLGATTLVLNWLQLHGRS